MDLKEEKNITDHLKESETRTSNIFSCRDALKEFLENYKNILKINKPIMEFFDKNYKHIIENLSTRFLDIDKEPEMTRKINIHFRIYPFWEYLALLGKTENDQQSNEEKMKTLDYSIFVRLIKQLIMILHYNIQKRRKNDLNNLKKGLLWQNIQINPLIGNDLKNSEANFEVIKSKYRDEMNLMVIELLEVSEVYCFLIPKNKDMEIRFSNEKNKNITFKRMEDKLESELEHLAENNNIGDLAIQEKIKEFVPQEIIILIESLIDASNKNNNDKNIDKEILECIFLVKEFELKNNLSKWKVDKYFLLEYYLMIQISRIANILSKGFTELKKIKEFTNQWHFYSEIKETNKKINLILPDLAENKKKNVSNFLSKVNYNYVVLLFWIGKEDFVKKLIFLEDGFENILKLKDLHENMTPLNLLYIFLTKIQSEMDECDLHKKFATTKALEYKLDFQKINILEDIELMVIEFLQNTFRNFFQGDDYTIIQENEIFLEKKIYYSMRMKNMIIKYESSVHKDSKLDLKDFDLIIEMRKNPLEVTMKIKFNDLLMTVENGEELLQFMHIIISNFEEVTLDVDMEKKIIIKTSICYHTSIESFFSKIIECFDFLLIVSSTFYNVCIKSIYSYRSTKDTSKYYIFVNIMKDLAKFHKKELKCFFPQWDSLSKIKKKLL